MKSLGTIRGWLLVCLGVFVFLCLAAAVVLYISPPQTSTRSKSPNPWAYGTEARLKGDCLMGRSERDFIQAIKLAQEGDQLSVRQMIGGGLVWYQEVGSRVTVLGEGAYSNVLEVRLMDGRKGWIAPRMIERQ